MTLAADVGARSTGSPPVAERESSDAPGPAMQSEVDFVLPIGYRDENGVVHREGRMRLATARDELAPPGRLAPVPSSVGYAAGVATTATRPAAGLGTRPTAPSAPGRLSTEDERRARLVELLEEMTARRRRP